METESGRRAWLTVRNGLLATAALIGVPPALGTLLGLLGRAGWAFDLFTHWPAQYFCLLAPSAALLLALRRWRLALLPAAFAAFNLALVLPVYWGGGDHAAVGRTYRLVSANIEASNTHGEKVLDLVRREDPDVVILLEFTPRWRNDLRALDGLYPVRLLLPHDDNFGVAVYSRLPVTDWHPLEETDTDLWGLRASLTVDGRPLHLIAVHTAPPIGGAASRLRNRQLRQIADLAAGTKAPLILAGDLNTSPWSPHFGDLLKGGGLRDSRRGFGIEPTWPSFFPPMRTPIDHCLVSDDVRIVTRHVGAETGSDHLPIVVDFAPAGD